VTTSSLLTASVRSDREASARITCGTALLWAASGFRGYGLLPGVGLTPGASRVCQAGIPVIWGDSVLGGICASHARGGRPTVCGRARSGLPAFRAGVTFAFRSDLGRWCACSQSAWACPDVWCFQQPPMRATRNAGGLGPIILVTKYPGLLLFRNVLTAELSLRFSHSAWLDWLVATCVGKTARCCGGRCPRPVRGARACFNRRESGLQSRRPSGRPPRPARHDPRALP